MLQYDLPDARVADLCAGSGALGLEALSRGAAFCDFVELTDAGVRAIQDNATALGALRRVAIHKGDALRFVLTPDLDPWDIAFADPPYRLGLAAQLATLWLARPFARLFTVEHEAHEPLPPGGDTRLYGGTGVTLFGRE